MSGIDIFFTFIIVILICGFLAFQTLVMRVKEIQNNWDEYKCNPAVIPFARTFGYDPVDTFTNCIKEMQFSQMDNILSPFTSVLGGMMTSLGNLSSSVGNVRGRISSLVGNMTGVFGNIFGVITSLMMRMQNLILKIRDMFMKLIASIITMVYILQSVVAAGESTVKGPIGKTFKKVSKIRLCFHPETKVPLANGNIVNMSDIKVDDVLVGDVSVDGILKLKGNNAKTNPFYRIYCNELDTDIYVTGTHKIYDVESNDFIPVSQYKEAIVSNLETDSMSCLITNKHVIPIGELTFWDWED